MAGPAKREPRSPHQADPKRMPTARSLEEAANSDNSLEGYVAINSGPGPHGENPQDHALTAELAYQFYLERNGAPGSAEGDWFRAERELRARRTKGNAEPPTIPGDAMNL